MRVIPKPCEVKFVYTFFPKEQYAPEYMSVHKVLEHDASGQRKLETLYKLCIKDPRVPSLSTAVACCMLVCGSKQRQRRVLVMLVLAMHVDFMHVDFCKNDHLDDDGCCVDDHHRHHSHHPHLHHRHHPHTS